MKNKTRFILFLICSGFLIGSISLLVGAPNLLTIRLSESINLPVGTITTWLGLIALPSMFLLGIDKVYNATTTLYLIWKRALSVLILFSVMWLPISFMLAGNLAFTFSNVGSFQGGQTAMKIFWLMNYLLVTLPLILSIVFGSMIMMSKILNGR
ncbi:MAG: hypothetical protein V2I33_13960 [Kangiellaceae bacterium]|jgi:hypothetical protein|nr:hypothetical protein [Kangiellaceae bacterium]